VAEEFLHASRGFGGFAVCHLESGHEGAIRGQMHRIAREAAERGPLVTDTLTGGIIMPPFGGAAHSRLGIALAKFAARPSSRRVRW
jgi:hypothetical protein